MEKCILGTENLQVTTMPGTYAGYYVEQQIGSFLNFARSYGAAGFTEAEIASAMADRDRDPACVRGGVCVRDAGGVEGESTLKEDKNLMRKIDRFDEMSYS